MIRALLLPGKRTLVLLFGLILFCIGSYSLRAQSPQFSQFYAAPLYMAPSFAGATDGSRIVMNYRNQWPEIPGAFVTYAFSFDHYFHNYRSGLGVLMFRDQAGTGRLATTHGGLVYSYNFKADHNWTVRPGLQFLYAQRTVDFHRNTFGDQLSLDGNLPHTLAPNPIDRIGYFDASSSVIAYNSNIWTGFSVDHLMKPNQSMTSEESRIPMKISLFGGYKYYFGGTYSQQVRESISVTAMFRNQGKFNQLDMGAYWSRNPISIGLLYRGIPFFNNEVKGVFNNDALIMMGGISTQNFKIGYSYDFTISRLITSTGGAHELSLIYHFNQGAPSKRQGAIPCPSSQL
jgi:type IX secretion system PorP/SprF family membrane protein